MAADTHELLAALISRYPGTALGIDAFKLWSLARSIGAQKIVELGVETGISTMALLAAAQENDGELISIEINPDCEEASGCKGRERWRFVCGDSRDKGLPAKLSNGPIDFLFVDTSHIAADTIQELVIWLSRLRNGGMAVFHDVKTYAEGVLVPIKRFLEESKGQWHYWDYPESVNGLGVLQRVA